MKRRVLKGVLVALALWPAAQFALTQAWAVNPWKLFGFAMYSVPGPRVELELIGVLPDGRGMRIDRRAYSPREHRLASRFLSYRSELGFLARGDELADGVLALRPEFESVVVHTRRYWIDPETALVTSRDEHIRHGRDGRRTPFEPPDG